MARNQIDADKYDPVSDHLIVTLTTVFDIGNYKLIRCAASVRCGGLYSEPELDFGELLGNTGKFLELGRAGADKDDRKFRAINLFWQGVAAYLSHFNAQVLNSCAIFTAIDVNELSLKLFDLHHNC